MEIIKLTDEICGMMQLALKESGIDFAVNNSDIECAKMAILFAMATNKKDGLIYGKYERILTELNKL